MPSEREESKQIDEVKERNKERKREQDCTQLDCHVEKRADLRSRCLAGSLSSTDSLPLSLGRITPSSPTSPSLYIDPKKRHIHIARGKRERKISGKFDSRKCPPGGDRAQGKAPAYQRPSGPYMPSLGYGAHINRNDPAR